MLTKEQVLTKIRKLIALATNDGATEAERERAMTQAHKFSSKYNLSLAMAEEAGTAKGEERKADVNEFVNVPWSRQIAAAIARLYFCNYSYFKGGKRHLFVGKESNVLTAQEMNNFVRDSAFREARAYASKQGGKRYERSFMEGVADTISKRVSEILKASEQQKPEGAGAGTSMVLASVYTSEREANQKLMDELYGKAKPGRAQRRKNTDTASYINGVKTGEAINLNIQVGNNTVQRTSIAG